MGLRSVGARVAEEEVDCLRVAEFDERPRSHRKSVIPSGCATAKGKQLKVRVTIQPESYTDDGGVWIDMNNGYTGLTGLEVSGKPTTKIVTFQVR